MDGFINVRDLIEVLLSYCTNNPNDKISLISTRDMNKIIPGFEAMSPRTRIEELVEYIILELKKKNLRTQAVFKLAITKD